MSIFLEIPAHQQRGNCRSELPLSFMVRIFATFSYPCDSVVVVVALLAVQFVIIDCIFVDR